MRNLVIALSFTLAALAAPLAAAHGHEDVRVCPAYNPNAIINACYTADVKTTTSYVNVPVPNGFPCQPVVGDICVPLPTFTWLSFPVNHNGAAGVVFVEATPLCVDVSTADNGSQLPCRASLNYDTTVNTPVLAFEELFAVLA